MKRISFLVPVCFCFSFASAQSLTKSAVISSQSGNVSWSATSGISTAIQTNDGIYLKSDLGANQSSNVLNLTGFGFNIPAFSTVSGITVTIKRRSDRTAQLVDKNIRLIVAGNQSGENEASATAWTSSDAIIKYGSTTDKWSLPTLTPAMFNANDFGLAFQVQNGATANVAFIDYVSITVTYSGGSQTSVRFVAFSSKKETGGMRLTWRVHEEDKLLRYEIERSTNGINFEKIAIVPAKAQEEYSYIDPKPMAGQSFYRIKGVDIDAKYGYSTVLSIDNGTSGVVFKAFPTIVQSQLTIQHDPAGSDTHVTITNQDGKTVKNLIPAKGSMETVVDLSTIVRGIYVMKYTDENGTVQTVKFLKQ
jgi:hypothetical protein